MLKFAIMQRISVEQFCAIVRVPSYILSVLVDTEIYFSGSDFEIKGKSGTYCYRYNKNMTISLKRFVPPPSKATKVEVKAPEAAKVQVKESEEAPKIEVQVKVPEAAKIVQECFKGQEKKRTKLCPFFSWW